MSGKTYTQMRQMKEIKPSHLKRLIKTEGLPNCIELTSTSVNNGVGALFTWNDSNFIPSFTEKYLDEVCQSVSSSILTVKNTILYKLIGHVESTLNNISKYPGLMEKMSLKVSFQLPIDWRHNAVSSQPMHLNILLNNHNDLKPQILPTVFSMICIPLMQLDPSKVNVKIRCSKGRIVYLDFGMSISPNELYDVLNKEDGLEFKQFNRKLIDIRSTWIRTLTTKENNANVNVSFVETFSINSITHGLNLIGSKEIRMLHSNFEPQELSEWIPLK